MGRVTVFANGDIGLPDGRRILPRKKTSEFTPRHDQCTCSFCGKDWQHHGVRVIAGPAVYICEECVDLCVEVLKQYPVANPEAIEVKEEDDDS